MTQYELGFAILGAGMVAEYHLNAIQECADQGARLVGVGHYNPARYEEISERFGVPSSSYDELLADPAVDAVCICTPSGQHAQQAIAAASSGKHVLVEKPMALSLADADAMIAACRENGVQLGVCLQRRAEPLFRRVHDAIHGGDLGEITLGVVTMPYFRDEPYYAQAEWRGTWAMDGGGVLMNQGIHIIDLLLWFLGDPVEVHAFADSRHRSVEIEDTAGAVLRFANGTVATITATVAAEPGFPHRLEVYGTNGGIQIEGESVLRWGLADGPRLRSSRGRSPRSRWIRAWPATRAASRPAAISPSSRISSPASAAGRTRSLTALKADAAWLRSWRCMRTVFSSQFLVFSEHQGIGVR